jgi:hypothetical protein
LRNFSAARFVPLCSHHRLQNLAFMIDGAPEVAEPAIDLHERLVQMPTPLRIAAHVCYPPLADLGGEHRAKPVPPKPNGLMADVDPTLGQEILDVAQRQWVSHVHHHDETDDLRRTVEISERVGHGPSLAWSEGPRAFALTSPSVGLRNRRTLD